MKQFYFLLSVLFIGSTFSASAQEAESDSTVFPYVLPIWGDKVQEKGMADQLQLPFGVNVNYVNSYMDLYITEFELLLGDKDLTDFINTETLNFTSVSATTNGANFRADAWILPFVNVYGLLSIVKGTTNVSLQPTWKDATGETILQLPEFSSTVEFNALAYGAGATLVFGWEGYFLSTDVNYSRTETALLEDQVGFITLSARGGYRFFLSERNKDLFIAPYVGMMYRNFVGARGSKGSIAIDEVFPEMDENFNRKADEAKENNQAIIDDPSTSTAERLKLQARNQAIDEIQDRVNNSGVFATEINYFIKKDLIQTVTFQFGFNLQLNRNWMFRGEYGVADSQRFLMTGVQYRFGVKKKEFR